MILSRRGFLGSLLAVLFLATFVSGPGAAFDFEDMDLITRPDDGQNVQWAMINAAMDGTNVVRLPPGIIYVRRPIVFPSGMSLLGSGATLRPENDLFVLDDGVKDWAISDINVIWASQGNTGAMVVVR